MSIVVYTVTRVEYELINSIAAKAAKRYNLNQAALTRTLIELHAGSNPLRLEDFLAADEGNFAHDIFGICRHFNPLTGTLQNFFSPRYSK